MIELTCEVCGKKFLRKPYEVKRNKALGRANLCGRSCHATHMNLSPAKQANTREILAERNANQYGEDNPNWRGGTAETVWGKKPKTPPSKTTNPKGNPP